MAIIFSSSFTLWMTRHPPPRSLPTTCRGYLKHVIKSLEEWFKDRTNSSNEKLVIGAAVDLTRNKSELIAENTLLRQQLIVLKR